MKPFNVEKLFDNFKGKRILVIGDVMLDSYVLGEVKRISPEAPVPVVSVSERYNRLGGAANVALNLLKLGAKPVLCSVLGNDVKGRELLSLLDELGLEQSGILVSKKRPTTVKFRIIGNKVQMLRVDEENTAALDGEEFNALLVQLGRLFDSQSIDGVVFEDYDKGLINNVLIDFVVDRAKALSIPVSVDPKRNNFNHYRQVTLFKPNLKELEEGLGIVIEEFDIEQVKQYAEALRRKLEAEYIMVTLSEHGVLLGREEEYYHFPSQVRNIADVSGAGDTVVSVVTLALSAGAEPSVAARIANIAGGLVCEKVGVVPVDKHELLAEVKKHLP